MSSATPLGKPPEGTLADRVLKATGANPLDCYQCGRCAAGCMQNVDGEMEISPTRAMRLLQLEAAFHRDLALAAAFAKQALGANTPWLCAGCQACTTRCPQGLDIAGTMDLLREEGLRRGQASTDKNARAIQAFHQTFVSAAKKRGRIHELGLVLGYKLRSGRVFEDAMLGPAMIKRGKLHILPEKRMAMSRVAKAAAALRQAEQRDKETRE